MKLKLVNLFSFSINVLLSFSFLPQKGSLISKRKFGIKLSPCDESFRKVVDCMRNKTFRITCIDERSF